MAIAFSIKNTSSFFRKRKILTLKQITSLLNDLMIYELPDDPEEKQALLNKTLDEFPSLLLGIFRQSVRGFSLCYDKKAGAYLIEVATPSPRSDWKVALDFISALALHLNSTIICNDEDNKEYAPHHIQFDYEKDIQAGINFVFSQAVILDGIYRQATFNQEMANQIRIAKNPIQAFEEMLYAIQYVDAYTAEPQFIQHHQTGKITGIYTFIANIPTIFPNETQLSLLQHQFEAQNNIKIEHWNVELVHYTDADDINSYLSIGKLNYADFIKRLPKNKYSKVDAALIVVKRMNRKELAALME